LAPLNGETKTLLYIEDNLSNLSLIDQLLSECAPIKLISAMQGQLGIELAARHQPDLILLDVHLPDINGAEVLARLKAKAAPAIFRSSFSAPMQPNLKSTVNVPRRDRLLNQTSRRRLFPQSDRRAFLRTG